MTPPPQVEVLIVGVAGVVMSVKMSKILQFLQ